MTSSSSHQLWGDLLARVISSIGLIIVSAICIIRGGLLFDGLLLVLDIGISYEIASMFLNGRSYKQKWVFILLNIGVLFSFFFPRYIWASLVVFATLLWGVPCTLLSIFLATACACLLYLRQENVFSLVFVIVIVCISDISAYFAGRIFGGPKLAPRISPGKTRSGALGGVVMTCLTGCFMAQYIVPGTAFEGLLWGLLLGLCAQVGDLAESALKRKLNVKDSSSLLPGHGGLMDRFDGLVAALPVATAATFGSVYGHFLWVSFL